MVSVIREHFPIAGDFLTHIEKGQSKEILRDSLRLVVAAVATFALGYFPTISAQFTALVSSIPYVGSYIGAGISAGLSRFQLLTPIAQYAALGAVSIPALALASGAWFIASGVAAAYHATMAMSVLGGLDVAAKLATGLALLTQCHKVKYGALECVAK